MIAWLLFGLMGVFATYLVFCGVPGAAYHGYRRGYEKGYDAGFHDGASRPD